MDEGRGAQREEETKERKRDDGVAATQRARTVEEEGFGGVGFSREGFWGGGVFWVGKSPSLGWRDGDMQNGRIEVCIRRVGTDGIRSARVRS